MSKFFKKAAIAVATVALGFGGQMASAAPIVIQNNSSATVGGWTITTPVGIALTIDSSDNNTLLIEKAADFTAPQGGLLISFLKTGTTADANVIFGNEAVSNSTGHTWSGFDFLLLNELGTAKFDGVGNVFAPPTGYTGVSLDSTHSILSYTGSQATGTTSMWGSSVTGDELLIDAGSASAFVFKELPVVPLPAAAWQGLAGLAGLGAIASVRKLKNRMA
jgi:hypothetical protein